MGTINSAFAIISGALEADQSALSIIAGNVANANTPGYTTEVANFSENRPITTGGGAYGASYGDGVTETGATSLRDRVLEGRLDQQQQLAASSSTRLSALNSLEALFPPDSGSASATAGDIGSDITTFFNAFSSLEAEPTSVPLREDVLSSASTLAGDISNDAASLNQQQSALNQEATGVTAQVNALTTAIAGLNVQIQSNSPASDAGTLEDQRQQDISSLSQLVGINQVTTENNGLTITTTAGTALVSEGTSYQLTNGAVDGVAHFYVDNTDITTALASGGGQLGGYLTARDGDIPTAMTALNQLAYSISTSINGLNNSGTDLNGVEGTGSNKAGVQGTGTAALYLFSQPTEVAGAAAAMSVVMTDPSQISAAGLGLGSGDNSNITAMANLNDEAQIQPAATTTFSVTQNLDSATPVGGAISGSVTLYDSVGKSYDATITYTNEGSGNWGYSVALPDTVTADTSIANQTSYAFGSSETVDASTNLTITGAKSGGGTATITAPTITPGEAVGSAGPPPTGYVAALDSALTAAGITGVTISTSSGSGSGSVLTIAGASATTGNVVADTTASASASGTLAFNSSGVLTSPAANISGISFSGLSDGATPLSLTWSLNDAIGAPTLSLTTAGSAQTAQTQNGSAGVSNGQTPTDFYSSFVSTLGATVSGVQADNTAQTASVTQLQTQNNALSEVNLNDEASAMSTMENSYQAAAQVFNLLNTVMTSALNLGEETTVT